jgi:predicted nucleic acid-binding protein
MTAANRCFVDSNVWIYAATQSEDVPPDPRHEMARTLLAAIEPYLSVQVINEISVNLIRKFQFSEGHIQALVRSFYEKYTVCPMNEDVLLGASALRASYSLSFWDSMIVSTALQYQCQTLYTEDMRDKLVIDNTLTIVNPFRD